MAPLIFTAIIAAALGATLFMRRRGTRRRADLARALGLTVESPDAKRLTGEIDGFDVRVQFDQGVLVLARIPLCPGGAVAPTVDVVHPSTGDGAFDQDFVVEGAELIARLGPSARNAVRHWVRDGLSISDGDARIELVPPADRAAIKGALSRVVAAAEAFVDTAVGDGRSLSAHLGDRASEAHAGVAQRAIDALLALRMPDLDVVERVLRDVTNPSVRIRAAFHFGVDAQDVVRPSRIRAPNAPQRSAGLAASGLSIQPSWAGSPRAQSTMGSSPRRARPLSTLRSGPPKSPWQKPAADAAPSLLEWAVDDGWLPLASARAAWRALIVHESIGIAVGAAELLGTRGASEDAKAVHAALQAGPAPAVRRALRAALDRLSATDGGQLTVAGRSSWRAVRSRCGGRAFDRR